MSRRVKLAIAALVVAVLIGAFYFPKLRQRVLRMSRPARTEEQARREVTQPPIATPSDVKAKAKIFWASAPGQRTLPADVILIEFYKLADGTAVADFSDALATATPSGILSEQMALDSIA